MDWNNYFVSGSNQNYNFVPGNIPSVGSDAAYQHAGQQNWHYYTAYNQNYISEPSSLQHVVSPLVAQHPYGGIMPHSLRDFTESNAESGVTPTFPAVGSRDMRQNAAFSKSADALASILSASSLTPTAGEFVPRSKTVDQKVNNPYNVVHAKSNFATSSTYELQQQQQPSSSATIVSNDSSALQPDVKELVDRNSGNNSSNSTDPVNISLSNSSNISKSGYSSDVRKGTGIKNDTNERSEDKNYHTSGKKNFNWNQNPTPFKKTNERTAECDRNTRDSGVGDDIKAPPANVNKSLDVPIRKGSGRILQNKLNDHAKGSSSRDSKNQGRQRLLAQAATFYSSSLSVENKQGVEVTGNSKTGDRQVHQRENVLGKNFNQDTFSNSGRSYYNQTGNRANGRMQENDKIYEGNPSRDKERNASGGRPYYSHNSSRTEKNSKGPGNDRTDNYEREEKVDKINKNGKNNISEKYERDERSDKDESNDRGERSERNMKYERREGNEREERNDRSRKNMRDQGNERDGGNERDEGNERSGRRGINERGERYDRRERNDWNDRSERWERGERNEWNDAGERWSRGDRWERSDRNAHSERGNRRDRDSRGNQGERVDKFERADKGDKNDVGKYQKTFFNNRFNSRNYDASPTGREARSENSGTFFQKKGQRYGMNQHSNETKSENNNNLYSKSDSNLEHKYMLYEHSASESDNACGELENNKVSSDSIKNFNKIETGKSFNMLQSDGRNMMRLSHTRDAKLKDNHSSQFYHTDDEASQRERLSDQLSRGALECLVCCERVRQHDAVWSCSNCYHVLHLRCTKKWAKSSKAESGWRCPACQNVTSKVPQEYRCFCGKMRDPEWNRQDLPHTCGEVCGRARAARAPELGLCVHRCTLLCHPGPCPSCMAQVNRECGCGKTSQIVSCGNSQPLLCDAVCEKLLNCKLHQCTKPCHWGACADCEEVVKQECFCGKGSREVSCTAETATVSRFSCQEVCGKILVCGNHNCSLTCHEGECAQCELMPSLVTHCPCGKTSLAGGCERTSCLDPVPTCGQECGKQLSCGQPGYFHECQADCHVGPCPPCHLTTFVKCRCGHMDREIECKELTTKADDARCEKRCSKKRACGKHKCNQMCCIDVDHLCPLPCNHLLSCGQHRCEELCHRGHCQPCWRTSFEELYCECGASVMFPPVPCGTRRPVCTQPCSRSHPCEHDALHLCHSEPTCPPCTVLMEKYCYGKHELRKAVPCHQTEFSCGMPCTLPLPCGRHTCIRPCHKGSCVREGQPICTQPCKTPRTLCGHSCAAPCHDGPCPETPCKETVRVTCECGHRSTTRPCYDQTKEFRRVLPALLASKMHEVQLGHSVDVADLCGSPATNDMNLKTLDCNDECKIIERNRRLAIGLQIRNPDLSSKLKPRYSEFMRQWGKKDPFFVTMVHDRLSELVQLAKQSKQKSRSYSFSSMNREKRQFIHEYCEHFGCESQAYDPEPNRNVVATAQRDRAWLPSMSLLEVLQRESGQRKVPKPVTARIVDSKIKENPLLYSVSQTKSSEGINKTEKQNAKEEKEEVEVDYFEWTS